MTIANSASFVSLDEFCRAPVGAMTAAEHVLVWFPEPRLRIMAFWSLPTIRDAMFTERTLLAATHEDQPKHVTLVDMRRVTGLEYSAFGDYAGRLVDRGDAIAKRVSRSAMLILDNDVGNRLRLVGDVVEMPYKSRIFEDEAKAMEWLGVLDMKPDVMPTVEATVATISASDSLVRRGREYIREHLDAGQGKPSLNAVAAALRVAGRSVQRAFAAVGSSYRHELRNAQIARAMHLLSTTDMKLSGIALEVGFRKLENLNTLFLSDVGYTAAAWRRAHPPR